MLGLFIGLAGTTFAVGIAYTSAWFPQRLQGTALGIFGAGNTGASLTKLLAPGLMPVVPAGGYGLIPGGWRFVPFVYAIAVLVTAAIYWTFTYTDHSHHKQESVRPAAGAARSTCGCGASASTTSWSSAGTWRCRSGCPSTTSTSSACRSARRPCSPPSSSSPPASSARPGGWLSDRYGARTVMYWVLSICVVATFLLCSPTWSWASSCRPSTPARGEAPRLSLRMAPSLFTVLVFVLGLAMGIGKAAVFKHIPHYFPDKVGSVGGLVGVIGGLGGFVMPILFGAMTQATHLPTTTFAFLFVLSVTCLVWMQVVVPRMSREAAPNLAEELESGLQVQ